MEWIYVEESYGINLMGHTTGVVEWKVRVEYVRLNKSKHHDGVSSFVMIYEVVAETTKQAWDEALSMFEEELVFDERTYGRREMSVYIES